MPHSIHVNGRFVVLALVLAFAVIGTRGLWDPDEGRYTNVALHMLESGDWVHPMRSDEVGHWTKPPLSYWAIAGSVGMFGHHPGAARLPGALAFLASIWLTFRIARRIAPGTEGVAALFYATMALPLIAAHWISTDPLLAAMTALAALAFVEARAVPPGGRQNAWIVLMWAAFAAGFLTKGPPAMLLLPVFLLVQWLAPEPRLTRARLLWWPALLLFAAMALSWYAVVTLEDPALASYFLGKEVIRRIAGSEFRHSPEWYGWLKVYLPTLLFGTLPWTALWLRALRRLPGRVAVWRRAADGRRNDAGLLLLWFWLALPLAVFCLVRSRLPLYLLPVFPALAMIAAAEWCCADLRRHVPRLWLGMWLAFVLALRIVWAWWPTDKDASAFADAIRERVVTPIEEVIFIDHPAHYGLHLHLGVTVERLSLEATPDPRIAPTWDHELAHELEEGEFNQVFVVKAARWPTVAADLARRGYRAASRGEPYRGRVIFEVEPE